jgi:large exoprotein involved in heme utilization and adhesion
VDTADSIELRNASQISSDSFGAGKAGTITLRAGNEIRVLTDSFIASDAYAAGHAGSINITVPSLTIDGAGGTLLTQVSSQALENSQGNAGSIHITTPIGLRLSHGGKIVTSTYKSGNGGDIQVDAGAVLIDGRDSDRFTGIFSTANYYSSGNAGSIRVTTSGELHLIDGGRIETSTYSLGNGGSIQVAANTLRLDGRDSDRFTGIFSAADFDSSGNAGSVRVTTSGDLHLIDGGKIETSTYSLGNGGTIDIDVAGDAQILRSSAVSSNTWALGNAGSVVFSANNLLIDGMGNSSGAKINSGAGVESSGNSGSVTVNVPGHLEMFNAGSISSSTSGQGSAGAVTVSTGRLTVDGKSPLNFSGIDNATYRNSNGNGGPVIVTVAGDASITNGYIKSESAASGRGGDISLVVGGDLALGSSGRVSSRAGGSGNAGNINIKTAKSLTVGGGALIQSDTSFNSSGDAGRIDINASQVMLARGDVNDFAWIVSDSLGSGAGGAISVKASKSIELAEGGFITSDAYSTGHAGTVLVSAPTVRIGGPGLRMGAAISSDANIASNGPNNPSGNAGAVTVVTQNLTIEGGDTEFPTGITSRTYNGNSGSAGSIAVFVRDQLQISNDGVITSSTNDSGRGGEVQVKAGTIEINGSGSQIGASASSLSSGRPGNLTVQSDGALMLRNGGRLTIANGGNNAQPSTVAASALTVQAAALSLDGGAIKANSTGNVAAGTIQINASERITLNQEGSITTSANSGNGGTINVSGGKLVALNNSQITTSVLGTSGNGGDIQIGADSLVLNSGFIQANTAASNASGGLVNIGTKTLLASGSTLFVGGPSVYKFTPGVFGFNVIQAAAPSGVNGAIQITSPKLDLSGSLVGLSTEELDLGGLGRNPCDVSGGSSLVQLGYGGMPISYRGLLGGPSQSLTGVDVTSQSAPLTSGLAKLRRDCL